MCPSESNGFKAVSTFFFWFLIWLTPDPGPWTLHVLFSDGLASGSFYGDKVRCFALAVLFGLQHTQISKNIQWLSGRLGSGRSLGGAQGQNTRWLWPLLDAMYFLSVLKQVLYGVTCATATAIKSLVTSMYALNPPIRLRCSPAGSVFERLGLDICDFSFPNKRPPKSSSFKFITWGFEEKCSCLMLVGTTTKQ